MADAPFGMTELTTLTPGQQAVRNQYQAILDRLDPANGRTVEGFSDLRLNTPEWKWKTEHFGIQGGYDREVSGDNADPDNDGVPNILERAFGWDPKDGKSRFPQPENASGQWRLTLPPLASPDVRVIVEKRVGHDQWVAVAPAGKDGLTFAVSDPNGKEAEVLRVRGERVKPLPPPGPGIWAAASKIKTGGRDEED